jgi:hypothetical protein
MPVHPRLEHRDERQIVDGHGGILLRTGKICRVHG